MGAWRGSLRAQASREPAGGAPAHCAARSAPQTVSMNLCSLPSSPASPGTPHAPATPPTTLRLVRMLAWRPASGHAPATLVAIPVPLCHKQTSPAFCGNPGGSPVTKYNNKHCGPYTSSLSFHLPASTPPGASRTSDAAAVGTWAYLAPEYKTEGRSSPATDAWALGLCLLQLVLGREPRDIIRAVQQALEECRLQQVGARGVRGWRGLWGRRRVGYVWHVSRLGNFPGGVFHAATGRVKLGAEGVNLRAVCQRLFTGFRKTCKSFLLTSDTERAFMTRNRAVR